MATVIDSLTVALGLEAKAFTKGSAAAISAFRKTGQEAQTVASDMESKGKQAAQFFTKIRNEALTFFAVFTAGVGLKNFITDTINSSAALGRMAPNLRMSTQELAAYQRASERAGGTAEGMTAQLRESAAEIAKYKAGLNSESIAWFFRLGGDANELRDGNSFLLARAKLVKEAFDVDPTRAALIAGQLGISDDQFNLIKQGPAAILALVDAQRKNAVVTAKDAAEAENLRVKMLDLRDTLVATGTRVLLTLAPVLERLLEHFQSLATWVADHRDEIAQWLEDTVKWVIEFSKSLDEGVESIGGWKTVIVGLLALNLLPAITSFVALAAAILGVGKALGVAGTATSAAAAGGGLFALLKRLGVGAALLLHTDSLGEGEQEELARRRALGDAGPVMTGTRPPMGNLQDTIMDSLMAKGWTRAQAAGLAANFKKESEFNHQAVGDGGNAYGIAQWHPDRQKEFAKRFGKDIRQSTLEEQLEFADYELREGNERGAGDRLRQATNAANAGAIVSKYYERPADVAGNMSSRAQLAAAMEAQERMRSAGYAAANMTTAQSAGAGRGFAQTSTSTTDISIGKVEVVTQATDAEGIARDMGAAIRSNSFVTQANTGLQ